MNFLTEIKANAEELASLLQEVEIWCLEKDFSIGTCYAIQLAVEELATNTIKHATGAKDELYISVSLEEHSDKIRLTYTDNARLFNPLDKENPDVDIPIEQRKVGGLGILLIKKVMDTIDYQYKDGKNIIILTKNTCS